jgi:hypothetical protein
MAWVKRMVPHCNLCGHEWLSGSPSPKRCAKCKSAKWNKGMALPPGAIQCATIPVEEYGANGKGLLKNNESQAPAKGWPTGAIVVKGGFGK